MKKRAHIKRWAAGLLAVCCLALSAPIQAFAADKPSKPAISSAKLSGKTAAKVTWKKASGAKKYEVFYSVNGSKYKSLKTTTAKSYTHKKLKAGTTYAYKVRALNGSAKSGFSGVKKVKTLSASKPKLKAKASGATITLTWSKVKNASGYYVYKKTGSGYKKIGSTKNLVYKVKKVELNTNYTFKVTPYVSNNGSATTGTGATVKIKSAKSAYLMDIAPPYRGSYFDYTNSYFLMGGNRYTHGFTCGSYFVSGDEDIYFNLKGKYRTISFTSGLVDDSDDVATIYIFSDGDLISSYSANTGKLPSSYTVNVTDCIQLLIRIERDGRPQVGFGNIKVSK